MSDQRRRSASALVSTVVALVVILGAGLAGASQSGLGEIVAQAQRVFSVPGGTHAHVRASDRDIVQPPRSEGDDGLVGSPGRDAANGVEGQTDESNVGSSADVGGRAGGEAREPSGAEGSHAGDGVGGNAGGYARGPGNAGDRGNAGGGGNGGNAGGGGNGGSGAGGGGGSVGGGGGAGGSGGGGDTPGGGHAGGGLTGNSSRQSPDGGGHDNSAGEMAGGDHDGP